MQPHHDLGVPPLELRLQPHGVVAGVEDEQGRLRPVGQPADEVHHLPRGHVVGVSVGRDTPGVHRRDPGVPLEAELCHELVGPAGHDGLSGRVPEWVVEVTALGTGFGIAPGPRADVHRVDLHAFFGERAVRE
jgi:hypothetical protein